MGEVYREYSTGPYLGLRDANHHIGEITAANERFLDKTGKKLDCSRTPWWRPPKIAAISCLCFFFFFFPPS